MLPAAKRFGGTARVKGIITIMAFLAGLVLQGAVSNAIAAPATQATKPVLPSASFDARLQKAAAAIDDGQFEQALGFVKQAEESGSLAEREADWAAYLKARALAATGKADEAQKVIRERQRAYPNAYNWASLVSVLSSCGLHEEAAKAILDLDDSSFLLTNRLRYGLVESILNALEASKSPLRDPLVSRLVEGRYMGPSSLHIPDTIRLRYIALLLRQNRIEGAVRETQSVESPVVLSILLADKAFAPLWSYPSVRKLMAPGALAARVDRGIQARLEQPHLSSSDWLDLMRTLRIVGKPDEAVRLGLNAIEQARSDKRATSVALRLEVANAYADMGEAWAARRSAKEMLKEQALLPVSLRLDIANLLELTGDDEGALLMIGTMQGVEAQSRAQKIIVCAAHDLGRNERRDEAMAQLEASTDASPIDLMDALVCIGQRDKAGKVLVSMLDNPQLRSTAILTAQLYEDRSKAGSDLNDLRYRLRALVATEAVQEGLKPHARTMGLPFTFATAR